MRIQLAIILLIVCTTLGFSENSLIWERSSRGVYEDDIRHISVNSLNEKEIYVGTSKALYRSSDGGRTYQVTLKPSGEQKSVNDIYISVDQPQAIYAATDAGLYETFNGGETWSRIYYSSNAGSRSCLAVVKYGSVIYLGTRQGLFQKRDKEANWQKYRGDLSSKPVYQIIHDDKYLYIATGQSLFSIDKQTHELKNIFSTGIRKGQIEGILSDQAISFREDQIIRFIEVPKISHPYLFVASTRGVYFSRNYGEKWQSLPADGLAVEDITSLLLRNRDGVDEGNCSEAPSECLEFLAGTKKGVYFFKNGKWVPLYKGMETNEVSHLAASMHGNVYAATKKGIYFLSVKETLPSSHFSTDAQMNMISKNEFDHEPGINEVHKLAIDYAEVSHEKIADWRILAKQKAILPDLSVGLDRNASDLFHWNTGASPDELQKGRDYVDWDVSMSWDLADLIWSTDQTTIDSRSKLMVELREDILNEVTRLYFERRRNQIELMSDSLIDPQWKMDKQMRIAELTALIDALTGGQFSERIKY